MVSLVSRLCSDQHAAPTTERSHSLPAVVDTLLHVAIQQEYTRTTSETIRSVELVTASITSAHGLRQPSSRGTFWFHHCYQQI